MSKVFTVSVDVSEERLQSFIDVLNNYELYDDQIVLTVENVVARPKLLEYICKEAVLDGTAMYDPHEFWNMDGWSDIRDYLD